jgi:hypothetical protein
MSAVVWHVVIEGLPLTLSSGVGAVNAVAVSETAEGVPVHAALVAGRLPVFGTASLDGLSGQTGLANLTFDVTADDVTVSWCAYARPPLAPLAAPLPATDTTLVLHGDVTGSIQPGQALFIGRETISVTGPAVFDAVSGRTSVPCERGRFGSAVAGSGPVRAGTAVHGQPIIWAGRACQVQCERDGELSVVWRGTVRGFSPLPGGVSFRFEALPWDAVAVGDQTGIRLRFLDRAQAQVNAIFAGLETSDGLSDFFVFDGPVDRDASDEDGVKNARAEYAFIEVDREIVRMQPIDDGVASPLLAGIPSKFRVRAIDRGVWGSPRADDATLDEILYQTGAAEPRPNARRFIADHPQNLDIHQLLVVTGHPAEVALRLLCSGGGGGPWDTLLHGAAMTDGRIDTASFTALADEFDGLSAQFVAGVGGAALDPVAGARLCLGALGAILTTGPDGRVQAVLPGRPPLPLTPAATGIDAQSLARTVNGEDALPTLTLPLDEGINRVAFGIAGDFKRGDNGGGAPTLTLAVTDAELRAAGTGDRTLEINGTVLQPGSGRAFTPALGAFFRYRAQRLFLRYGRPLPELACEVIDGDEAARSAQPGATVGIDLTGVPGLFNPATGRNGYTTARYEITERRHDPARGVVSVRGVLWPADQTRRGVVAPSARITAVESITFGDADALRVTLENNLFVEAGSDNPLGETDGEHYGNNQRVRIYAVALGRFRTAGWSYTLAATGEDVSGATVLTLTDLPAGYATDPMQPGDLLDDAPWFLARLNDAQHHHVHCADDGDKLIPAGPGVADAPFQWGV